MDRIRPPPTSARDARIAVLGAFVALGTAAGNWGSRVPDVKADLGLSEGALGTALLMLSVGAVCGSWVGGLLVRRLGLRAVVRGSWILLGLALVAPGATSSWLALASSLLAFGLTIGLLDVSMNGAGVVLEAAADRPLLNGLHAGWSAGVLAGAAMGAIAVTVGASTLSHLAVAGVAICVSGLMLGNRLPDGQIVSAPREAGPTDAIDADPRRRRLVALAAIAGFVFLAEGAMLDWVGILVRETLAGGDVAGVVAVIGVATGGLLGRLAGDRMTARWGAARLVRNGALTAAAALGAVLLLPVAGPAPLLVLVVGAGIAPAVPLAFAAAGRLHGATGIATVTTAGYGCYLVGPAAIGWLGQHVGLRTALVLPLVLVACVASLAWSTGTTTELHDDTPHPEPM
jgi:fucose permease